MGPMQALCMRATVQCLYEGCRSLPFNQNVTQEDHGLIYTVHVIIVIHIKIILSTTKQKELKPTRIYSKEVE